MKTTSASGWIGLVVLVSQALACGGGQQQPASQDDDVDPRLAMIMQWEQEIAEGKEFLATGVDDCNELCRAATLICNDSEQICLKADDMREPDSRGRCERARTDCTDERAKVVARCGACGRLRMNESTNPGYSPLDD